MSDEQETVFEPVTNAFEAPEESMGGTTPWESSWRVLTPHMRAAGGSLGMVMNRLGPGSVGCPFHWHQLEDEIFYIISGKGRLRYGEMVRDLVPGDCISCPAGTQVAHQIANISEDEDLIYLAVGPRIAHEVCGYPDTGKVFIRAMQKIGTIESQNYMDGEPDSPKIFSMTPDADS